MDVDPVCRVMVRWNLLFYDLPAIVSIGKNPQINDDRRKRCKNLSLELLDFDLGSSGLDLLLDLFGLFLGRSFLDGLGSALDEGLGLGKT